MKWIRALLYTIGFIVAFGGVSVAVRVTGIDVAIARGLVTPRMTYSQAYQLLNNTTTILSLLVTIGLALCVYAIRHPGALPAKARALREQLKDPSPGQLVVVWVVAVCTIVGYIAAIYATWHFVAKRMAGRSTTPNTPLVARLAELDSAQRAGLISPAEHTAKRTEILNSY
jgi:hypothetical protein